MYETLLRRIQEPRRFIEVLAGPRQTGKTTLARQMMASVGLPVHYASADEPTLRDRAWLAQQWELSRLAADTVGHAVVALDEIQKVAGWSETVKRLWDEDSAAGRDLRVVLLGSAPLLVQRGLSESLAGRFEVIPVMHWSYAEIRAAFGWDVETYVYFGGYPGAAGLIQEPERWRRYILDALVEPTIARDVLLLTRVDKPALLRRLFQLACAHSGQVVAYQKMVGQLQDAGNTTTLAHYLDLLAAAGMVTGLQKFSGQRLRQRASSPKLQALNTALITAQVPQTWAEARADGAFWGQLVESAVGAHLVNTAAGTGVEVAYWREGGREVDFVLYRGDKITAIEVKSGRPRGYPPGLAAFESRFGPVRQVLVGPEGVALADFLTIPASEWVA
jgi:predicted AAA+ superfamily ATPase